MTTLRMLIALGVSLSLAGAYACGGSQTQMTPAAGVPAAQGKVEAKKVDNGNTEITVEVKHLAAPEKVKTGASTYVVWLQARGQKQQNIGALAVDKNLTGTLKTSTPHADFKLSITAEPFPQAEEPTGPEVLSATVRAE